MFTTSNIGCWMRNVLRKQITVLFSLHRNINALPGNVEYSKHQNQFKHRVKMKTLKHFASVSNFQSIQI